VPRLASATTAQTIQFRFIAELLTGAFLMAADRPRKRMQRIVRLSGRMCIFGHAVVLIILGNLTGEFVHKTSAFQDAGK
jgi:hypothetical protein